MNCVPDANAAFWGEDGWREGWMDGWSRSGEGRARAAAAAALFCPTYSLGFNNASNKQRRERRTRSGEVRALLHTRVAEA